MSWAVMSWAVMSWAVMGDRRSVDKLGIAVCAASAGPLGFTPINLLQAGQ
jgi:hypothetical protein